MVNAGLFLIAYASFQTLNFLKGGSDRVWAKRKYHRYDPTRGKFRDDARSSCAHCLMFQEHPQFTRAGICTHPGWNEALRTPEVMVQRRGHCDLWSGGKLKN